MGCGDAGSAGAPRQELRPPECGGPMPWGIFGILYENLYILVHWASFREGQKDTLAQSRGHRSLTSRIDASELNCMAVNGRPTYSLPQMYAVSTQTQSHGRKPKGDWRDLSQGKPWT